MFTMYIVLIGSISEDALSNCAPLKNQVREPPDFLSAVPISEACMDHCAFVMPLCTWRFFISPMDHLYVWGDLHS